MRHTINWTETERSAIMENAVSRLIHAYVSGKKLSWCKAVTQAQEVSVPSDRWRGITSLQASPATRRDVLKAFETARASVDAQRKSMLTLEPIPEPNPTPPETVPVPTLDNLLGQILIKAIGEALLPIVERLDRLEKLLTQEPAAQDWKEPTKSEMVAEREEVRPPAVKLPKVLVVGPLADQQQVIRSALGGVLDLRFVASNEGATRVYELAKTAAQIFVMTKFVGHDMTRDLPRNCCHLIHGGVRQMVDAITDWWAEQ